MSTTSGCAWRLWLVPCRRAVLCRRPTPWFPLQGMLDAWSWQASVVSAVPLYRQPWHVFELKLPADGGQRALEWSQKLGMDWLHFRLQDYFKRLQVPA